MKQLKGRAILRGKKLKKDCHKATIINLGHNIYTCCGLVVWNEGKTDYYVPNCCLNCKAYKYINRGAIVALGVKMNNGIQEVKEKTVDKMIDYYCSGMERKGCKRVFCLNKKYQTFVAVDDSTNDCWVESFETREKAIRWLENA